MQGGDVTIGTYPVAPQEVFYTSSPGILEQPSANSVGHAQVD
jgi:hypothetical protein